MFRLPWFVDLLCLRFWLVQGRVLSELGFMFRCVICNFMITGFLSYLCLVCLGIKVEYLTCGLFGLICVVWLVFVVWMFCGLLMLVMLVSCLIELMVLIVYLLL